MRGLQHRHGALLPEALDAERTRAAGTDRRQRPHRLRELRHLLVTGRRLNGNFDLLREVIGDEQVDSELRGSFPLERLTKRENFLSLLHYFGLLSIRGVTAGAPRLGMPNQDRAAVDVRLPARRLRRRRSVHGGPARARASGTSVRSRSRSERPDVGPGLPGDRVTQELQHRPPGAVVRHPEQGTQRRGSRRRPGRRLRSSGAIWPTSGWRSSIPRRGSPASRWCSTGGRWRPAKRCSLSWAHLAVTAP